MNLNELIYSFKIENKKQNAKIIFQHNKYSFSVNAQSLLIKLDNACKELEKHSKIKINFAKNFVLEAKKPSKPLMYHENEELWYIYINNEWVDSRPRYANEYLSFKQLTSVLHTIKTKIEMLYHLSDHKISYNEFSYTPTLAFKITNKDEYISYRIIPLLNFGEVSDIILIIQMLSNYLISKDQKTHFFECLIEGEPTVDPCNNYIYIENNKLMIGYKPNEYFIEYHEDTNNEFEEFLQTDGTINEISCELYELLTRNKESIIKTIRKYDQQLFLNCLEKLSIVIKR